MKVKTSITLPEDLMDSIHRAARKGENRSQTMERLLRLGLAAKDAAQREAHDRAILERHADELNREAQDVLLYQVDT